MPDTLIAHAEIAIAAPRDRVWDALVSPAAIREYLFGTHVTSDWIPGGPIAWEGEWQGKAYRDTGRILRVERPDMLEYTHWSPLAGKPDTPENHHTVTVRLAADGTGTRVRLAQDNNATDEERLHSEKNWNQVLAGLKTYVER